MNVNTESSLDRSMAFAAHLHPLCYNVRIFSFVSFVSFLYNVVFKLFISAYVVFLTDVK